MGGSRAETLLHWKSSGGTGAGSRTANTHSQAATLLSRSGLRNGSLADRFLCK